MSTKTYRGSCHCGAVAFEVDMDLAAGTHRCNCSICSKVRAWFVIVKPEQFHLLQGHDAEREYQWTPPGKPAPFLHYRFCATCGVRTVGNGGLGTPKAFYFVPIASLDNVDADELAAAPIKYGDGRHGHPEKDAPDTRIM